MKYCFPRIIDFKKKLVALKNGVSKNQDPEPLKSQSNECSSLFPFTACN